MSELLNVLMVATGLGSAPLSVGVSTLVLLLLLMVTLVRGEHYRASSILLVGLSVSIFYSQGHDLVHHVARLLELARHAETGDLDLFVFVGENPVPVFYYYSSAIYLFALPFVLLGASVGVAIKIPMVAFFVLMVLFARRVFLMVTEKVVDAGNAREVAGIVTIMFLISNYTYMVFGVRNAFSEAAVYALVPAVLFCLLSRRELLAGALVCLQVSIHPPVMPQAAVAVALAYIVLAEGALLWKMARLGAVYTGATMFAFPAWFWAFRDKGLILGVEGLPLQFEETFLKPLEWLEWHNFAATGPYFALFILAALWRYRALSRRALVLLVAAVVIVFAQTVLMKPLVANVPLADIGLFIWRWMFVAVWLGVLAFALIWRDGSPGLVLRFLMILGAIHTVLHAASLTRPIMADSHPLFAGYVEPDPDNQVRWGHAEFYPNYPADWSRCALVEDQAAASADFRDIWDTGLESRMTLVIERAPIAGLRYLVDGEAADTIGCGSRFYIIHPAPGEAVTISVERGVLMETPMIRILFPIVALMMVASALIVSRRWPAKQNARGQFQVEVFE